MKLFNFVTKAITLLVFIATIGTVLSLGLSPKDKALEKEDSQFTKLIELTDKEYENVLINGVNVVIDKDLMNLKLDELGVSLINENSNFERFLANLFNKPFNYKFIIDEQKLFDTVQSINRKFESTQIPKIEIEQNRWKISPIKKDRFIDYNNFKAKIIDAFENSDFEINFKTEFKAPEVYAPTQELLDSIQQNLTDSIYIEINDFGEIKKYELSEFELFELLTPSILHNSVDININETLLNKLIANKLKDIPRNQEIKIKRKKVIGKDTALDVENISKEAYEIIKSRINHSNQTDKIVSNTKYAPFTNGDKFERYIEVDLSQKMLYAWENGKLKYEMLVSTGFNNTTPKGEYQIQNKADNPFSNIDNSYMPFWMSFHKDSRFDAWLGFHALTHKINSRGKYIYEPETNLGGTTSGGCVKLGRKEAEILYNWAVVGDKVIIHD